MFDIGFWELMIIFVVALIVIGPERLPGLTRKAGLWVGRGRRFVQSVKADIDRELAAEELKRIMKEQADSVGVHEIIEETKNSIKDTKQVIEEAKQDYVLKAIDDDVNELSKPASEENKKITPPLAANTKTAANTKPALNTSNDAAPAQANKPNHDRSE